MSTAYALTHPSGGAVHVPAHERVVLPNGITLLVVPSPEVPLISFHAVCRGGPLGDSRPGVASLVAGLLDKGAGARNAFEFVDAVEGAGGSFTTITGTEALSITGQFLARDQALMLELLSDAITRPRFEVAEFEKLRARRIELIKATKDSDPAEVIGTYGRSMLFGSHPYGKPAGGSEASLASITHQDVLDYYRAHIGADRLILVFAGDLDIAALKRDVAERFGSWRKAGVTAAPVPEPARARGRRVLLVDSPDSAQTYFWIGNVGVNKQYPEHAALDLVNTLYGGCFTSMLNTALRIKSGLSYSARAGFTRTAAAGEFAIRSFTDTENTATALDLSLQTLTRLKAEGVTAEMLDSARAYVLGQYPLNFETAADWAAALVELEFYGLGPEYIDEYAAQLRGVTLPVARGVIDHAFPSVADLVIVLIGDAAKIRRIARRYGELTEMALTKPSFSP
ncbi:MAG TPA: pitrilysin family protein [Steroidobacteraceae bacterium]|nr:pitrilysin family protein [Steroidobacteraceae bacterium]